MAYVPLSAEQYRQSIIAYLHARKSGLTNFKAGSRIGTLIEALALELARSDYEYLRSYREGIKEACYNTFTFGLKEGIRATGQVRVYNQTPPRNIEVPAFTITLFGIRYISEANPPQLDETTPYVDSNISAENPGTEYNLPANSIDTDLGQGIIEPRFEFARITNIAAISKGTDQESEASREQRFRAFIQNLSRVTISGIQSAVSNIPNVSESYVEQNINPVNGKSEYGWINVYVSDGASDVSQDFLGSVRNYLLGLSATNDFVEHISAGTRLFVSPITIQPINLSLSLSINNRLDLTDSQIKEQAQAVVSSYVNRLAPGQDVLLDHIKSVIIELRRQDIIYVTIETPTRDIVVPSRSLPRIGGAGGGSVQITAINRIGIP